MADIVYKKKNKVIGCHGTYPAHIDSIKADNFVESPDSTGWIGGGVYFFVEGIGSESPHEYAIYWATDEVNQKGKKSAGHKEVVALAAEISINDNKFLDLTIEPGLKLFNQFRDRVIGIIEGSGNYSKKDYKDVDVLNVMKEELGIEIVKAEVYIRFGITTIRKSEK